MILIIPMYGCFQILLCCFRGIFFRVAFFHLFRVNLQVGDCSLIPVKNASISTFFHSLFPGVRIRFLLYFRDHYKGILFRSLWSSVKDQIFASDFIYLQKKKKKAGGIVFHWKYKKINSIQKIYQILFQIHLDFTHPSLKQCKLLKILYTCWIH